MTIAAPNAHRGQVRDRPSTQMPNGWFQIGWSQDFPINRSVPLHYFGSELVAYRSSEGALHLLDAFCPHMGAHLGHGGRVEGECLRCPYHGWMFDPEGRNVDVPYGDQNSLAVGTNAWRVHEVDGIALAFHGPGGHFDPPNRFAKSDEATWPLEASGIQIWENQRMWPQVAADNVCDAAHFKTVHRSNDHAQLVDFNDSEIPFRAEYSIRFGGGVGPTWATPEGPIDGTISTESWGVGLLWNRLGGYDDVISLLGVTPIDLDHSDVRVSVWVPRRRGDGSELDEGIRDRWVREQHSQVVSDLAIWTHQTYVKKPPFLRSEAPSMRSYRKWSARFYDTVTVD